MNSDRKEKFNFVFYFLRHPGFLINFLLFFYSKYHKIIKKLRQLFSRRSNDDCPPYLKEEIKNYSSQVKIDLEKIVILKPEGKTYIGQVELAGTQMEITEAIDWEQDFRDPENYESLHRFNWLLKKLTEVEYPTTLKEWGEYYIKDWIKKFINQKDGSLKWETYTVAERICNFIIFGEKVGLKYDETFESALEIMADHVLENLEYYGEDRLFNHLINNARALYFYGEYFKKPFYTKCAKKIIENELSKLVTEDGFSREGSSHYHFLFTRWLLEIFYVAQKFGDQDLINFLEPQLKKLVGASWFFLVFDQAKNSWSIPLIGDVSPDFKPKWLIGFPFSSLALNFYKPPFEFNKPPLEGWPILFNDFQSTDNASDLDRTNPEETNPVKTQSFEASGWHRFDYYELTLYLHADPEGIPATLGHFHNDSCSFVLFSKGQPILIDTGRLNYVDDTFGNYGKSTQSHNSLLLDDLSPYPDMKYQKIWHRVCWKPVVTWIRTDLGFEIKIEHFGFRRLYNDRVSHERKFILTTKKFEIEDIFEGRKKHTVETFLHWAESLESAKVDSRKFELKNNQRKYILTYQGNHEAQIETHFGQENSPRGFSFSEYGLKKPIWTFVSKNKPKFPFKQNIIIDLTS